MSSALRRIQASLGHTFLLQAPLGIAINKGQSLVPHVNGELTFANPVISWGRCITNVASGLNLFNGGKDTYCCLVRSSSRRKAKGKGHVSFPNRRLFRPALALQADSARTRSEHVSPREAVRMNYVGV